jgi:ADP-ribosylglycohydrolase
MGHEVSNDSKGNGTVMRAATLAVHTALNNKAPASAFLLAKEDALMTHKHPHAWQSSVLLVAILLNQFQGMPLAVAVFDAASTLKDSLDPQVYAIALDCLNEKKYQCLLNRGRAGWVAEECLALAVGAAHHHPGFISTIAAAVSGIGVDSDTVAGVAGQLSCAGGHQIPRGFAARLEAFSAIKHIVDRYHNLT